MQWAIQRNTLEFPITRRKLIFKPWITPVLVKCMRNANNLHTKNKIFPNTIVSRTTYVRYRIFGNRILRYLKLEFQRNKIKKVGSNNKKLWQALNNVTNK